MKSVKRERKNTWIKLCTIGRNAEKVAIFVKERLVDGKALVVSFGFNEDPRTGLIEKRVGRGDLEKVNTG